MDVKCQDIHYSIGEKKILNGVSLEVEGGQFQTILGPNGVANQPCSKPFTASCNQIAVRFFLMGNP